MANARPAAKDAADVVLEVGALLCWLWFASNAIM
jgi:hypothetical protein